MQNISKLVSGLRKNNVNLIAVSNGEWLSLFRDEIRNSIAIEGVFTNRNELLQVLQNSNRTLDRKAAAILGYFEAASTIYEYGNNLFKENEFAVRISDIKQIHTLLMRYEKQIGSYRGELGDYRREVVQVTESKFTPLNPLYITRSMKIFLKWLNQNIANREIDKIRLAALSHLLFETIHPFRDGNGRVGRIFLSFLLIGFGYLNIAIKGTKKRDRDKYYTALENGDDNFEELMRKIESGFALKTSDIDYFVKKTDSTQLEKIIKDRLVDSVERLKQSKFVESNYDAEISLREAAKFFNYSQDYLRNLINKKRLIARKKGKLWFVKLSDIDRYVKETK